MSTPVPRSVMDIQFQTVEVTKSVHRLRERWWRIRVLAAIGATLGLLISMTINIFWGVVILSLAGAHLVAEVDVARKYNPSMRIREILRRLYVERRYLDEFSPRWRAEIAKLEVEILEEKLQDAQALERRMREIHLARQQQIAQAQQHHRNKERIATKAAALGFGGHFMTQVVDLLNADQLEAAQQLVDDGRNMRALLSRVEATGDEAFIEQISQLVNDGPDVIEAALQLWHRRKDLKAQAQRIGTQIDDTDWLERVLAACDKADFETAQQLLSEGAAWSARLHELAALEARVKALKPHLAGRRSILSGQISELQQTARGMKQRGYRKARYEIETALTQAESL